MIPTTRDWTRGDYYYVDPEHGNDAYDGSSLRPWRTVQHAMKQPAPGDTIRLRDGHYGSLEFNRNHTYGTQDQWITYEADAGHTPTFHNIVFRCRTADASEVDYYVRLKGLTVEFT